MSPSETITAPCREAVIAELKRRGWTQADLARNIGMTQKHVSQTLLGRGAGYGALGLMLYALGLEVRVVKGRRPVSDRSRSWCAECRHVVRVRVDGTFMKHNIFESPAPAMVRCYGSGRTPHELSAPLDPRGRRPRNPDYATSPESQQPQGETVERAAAIKRAGAIAGWMSIQEAIWKVVDCGCPSELWPERVREVIREGQ